MTVQGFGRSILIINDAVLKFVLSINRLIYWVRRVYMQIQGSKTIKDTNELCCAIICAKRGKIESHKLPPCRDSLKNHILRANYQCFIWRKCLEQSLDIPDLEDHGWKCESGLVSCIWKNGLPAPNAVLSLLSCDCKRWCVEGKCTCMVNGIKCTDMCSLKTFGNQPLKGLLTRTMTKIKMK